MWIQVWVSVPMCIHFAVYYCLCWCASKCGCLCQHAYTIRFIFVCALITFCLSPQAFTVTQAFTKAFFITQVTSVVGDFPVTHPLMQGQRTRYAW